MFAWWDSPIVKDLNLTEDQNRQIRSVVRDARSHLIDLRAAVQKAEADFQDVFNDDMFDQRRASDAADRAAAARAELAKATSQMAVRLRAILTADQWRELQKRRPMGQPGQMMRQMQQMRQPMRREGRLPGPGNPQPPQPLPPQQERN
jgi:Spy/CpxP family protein refolding chaperone